MEPLLKTGFLLTLLLAGLCGNTRASALELINPADAQHFEQTYEDWAKKLVHEVSPKLQFTILAEIEFTQNPERLQAFDDLKALDHLPGLPEVQDMNYSSPLDSPLLALVAKKSFKLISHSALSEAELALVREVLVAKLKLRGNDSLKIETLNSSHSPSLSFSHNYKYEAILLFGILFLAGLFFKPRKKQDSNTAITVEASNVPAETATPVKMPRFKNDDQTLKQILNTDRKTLAAVIASHKVETIARASLHASPALQQHLIASCTDAQFAKANEWLREKSTQVNVADASYARLLIAAQLTQHQNRLVLESIDSFCQARELKQKLQNSIRKSAPSTLKEASL